MQPPLSKDPLEELEHHALRKPERAYTNSSLIYDSKVAQKVFKQILDTGITLSQRELLSLAPELRTKVADATVKRCLTRTDTQVALDGIPVAGQRQHHAEAHMPAVSVKAAHEPPADATIIKDPYEAFLRSRLGSASSADDVKVAMESNSLSVAYSPNVRLNMVSANGSVNQSLGLAKNVPFQIGDITLYLQVHVLRQPTYDILLGRPFDVLTESVVCNYSNENQTITILDPNSGKKATIPTVKRGSYCFSEKLKRCALSPSNLDF
jgi:hypothetical protein